MSCLRCKSERTARIGGKTSDLCSVYIGTLVERDDGYVPSDMNIGGGDYLELEFCMDCGQMAGTWPLPETVLEDEAKRCDECGCVVGSERPTFPCKCDPSMQGRCRDCGILGEIVGHQTCEYPQDHGGEQ